MILVQNQVGDAPTKKVRAKGAPGSSGVYRDSISPDRGLMHTRIRYWRRIAIVVVVLALVATACTSFIPKDETLIELGLKDPPPPPKPIPPPPPPRYTVDIVVDTESVAAARPNVEEVIVGAVEFVATMDPASSIRLWVLDGADAQLLKRGDGSANGWVAAARTPNQNGRTPGATREVEQHLTALLAAPKAHGSPIAEALTKVSLSPPADRKHWFIVVVTDGVQERNACARPYWQSNPCQPRFNCSPPLKADWLKHLDDQRLLPSGRLVGAEIVFAFFEPMPESRCCNEPECLSSMAFVQSLQDLWRAALQERAGARVGFELRAPSFPNTVQAFALPATATKEVP